MTRPAFSLRLLAVFFAAFIAGKIQAAELASTNPPELPATAPPGPVLTNAEQVHWLTRQQATERGPVLIRGVVTCGLPGFGAAVVQDDTAGIYIDHWNASPGPPPE